MDIQADHQATAGLTRRDVLRATAAGLVIGTGLLVVRKRYFRQPQQAQTVVMKVADYQLDMADALTRGMKELGLSQTELQGKRILLKPNLNSYMNALTGNTTRSLPGERIAYGHIAGHHKEAADLIVDTHGACVIAGVWDLLDQAYQAFGVFPTLLERDFNLPPVDELLREVEVIRYVQQKYQAHVSLPSPARLIATLTAKRRAGTAGPFAAGLRRAYPGP